MPVAAPPKTYPSWLNADPLPPLEPEDVVGGRNLQEEGSPLQSEPSPSQDGVYKLPSQLAAGMEVEEDTLV